MLGPISERNTVHQIGRRSTFNVLYYIKTNCWSFCDAFLHERVSLKKKISYRQNLDSSLMPSKSYNIIWLDIHTGKTGKMAQKYPCQGKHCGFGNFAKTQGIWLAQVVNSLILMVKDFSIFAANIPKFCLKLNKSAKLGLCM